LDQLPPQVIVGADTVTAERKDGWWSIIVHRAVEVPDGSWDHPFANWLHYQVRPLDVHVRFPGGVPSALRITNAITDEGIEEAP